VKHVFGQESDEGEDDEFTLQQEENLVSSLYEIWNGGFKSRVAGQK